MSQLNERRILVTGAGSGIGAAIAEAVAAAGGSVAVNDLDAGSAGATADRLTAAGATAVAVPGDVSDESSVREFVGAAADALGGLDGLVNNAAILTMNPLADMPIAEWEQVLRINAGGQLICSRAALEHFGDAAAIVNIASIAGTHPGPGLAAYTMSKAAVMSFTKLAAVEWGPRGVRVNAIAPGSVSFTGMSAAETDEIRAVRGKPLPLGRTGRPADIADVAVFLLSDAARYVTGAVIPVDGGWSVSLMGMTPRPWES
jgi:NAD(P)-dependent dehydrogenase (short-subunit alcohol dehydrogenase family)